ncbi:MAG: sulfur carrier protein ThiS [Acidimicrobiia bacterium]
MPIAVRANGREVSVPEGATVGDLLDHLGVRRLVAAVERNGEPLWGEDYDTTVLEAGDRVELARLAAGG